MEDVLGEVVVRRGLKAVAGCGDVGGGDGAEEREEEGGESAEEGEGTHGENDTNWEKRETG